MHHGRLIAISDVHLDTWRDSGRKRQAFLDFLNWIRSDSGCDHFAIVGDLLDVPQVDHSPVMSRYRDVFTHVGSVMRSGIMVHWIVGNHDAGLVGLDVSMTQPPLQIAYPGALVSVGDTNVWLEHGHTLDAWLWAFLQYRASQLDAVDPIKAMEHFGTCGIGEPVPVPAGEFVSQTLYEAMQWRPMETGFTDDEKRLGIHVMSQHLDDDFSDVAADGEQPRHKAEIISALKQHGLTVADLKARAELPAEALDLFFLIGKFYYSPLPWRRAARCKLAQMRHQQGNKLRGLIMGHIHDVDLHSWDSDGDTLTYANCGTWSHDDGSFILVENGEMTPYRRRWDDPLPKL
ncbi:MAG: metallophosphoesterase [Armatimonadota bacterium]